MSSGQKVLKVLAIILAIFIIISICSAILSGVAIFSGIMYSVNHHETSYSEEIYTGETVEENIDEIASLSDNVTLKIDVETSNLEIRQGNEFKVQKINVGSNLKCKAKGNTLEIKEKDTNWFQDIEEERTVIVYVPKNVVLDNLEVSIGAGITNIQNLQTMKLEIEAGAGNVYLDNIVAQKSKIDGGAGNFTINNSTLNNLDFDCGVGVTKITGDIKGNSKVSCGVGKTELHLSQPQKNYKINMETGLGNMTLNGENCTGGVYGNGSDYIKIDGGVGSVEITTEIIQGM